MPSPSSNLRKSPRMIKGPKSRVGMGSTDSSGSNTQLDAITVGDGDESGGLNVGAPLEPSSTSFRKTATQLHPLGRKRTNSGAISVASGSQSPAKSQSGPPGKALPPWAKRELSRNGSRGGSPSVSRSQSVARTPGQLNGTPSSQTVGRATSRLGGRPSTPSQSQGGWRPPLSHTGTPSGSQSQKRSRPMSFSDGVPLSQIPRGD